MEFKDLADFCQAQAIANKLHPTDEAVFRQFCREYSVIFHTPYHEVLQFDPDFVILAVYEHQLDNYDVETGIEKLLDTIYGLEDPEYAQQKRDELEEFIREAEEEEELRLEEGRPIHKALKDENEVSLKNTPKNTPLPQNKNLPQGGGINLSYLEKEENGSNNEEF